MNKIADDWSDYECLYCGDARKIERWKDIVLLRPDPLAIWEMPRNTAKIDAEYLRSDKGGGKWRFFRELPASWNISYKQLTFKVAPLGFKHTGIFPEQAANWKRLFELITKYHKNEFRILNLFAYTGGATLACALADPTEIVHVDASKGMVEWAKENARLSHLENKRIRYIVDDCLKFILKEQRRGRSYQGIIMDPPSYGRGPNNEVWKFDQQINLLIVEAAKLLADDAAFFLVNTYTTGYSAAVLNNILISNTVLNNFFDNIETGELLIPVNRQKLFLPCGIYGFCTNC